MLSQSKHELSLFGRARAELLEFTTISDSLKHLILDSFPLFIYNFLLNIIFTINLHYIGLNGDSFMLAGSGLANTWIVATSSAIILGMNVGTLAMSSQALGAKEYRLAGLAMHRAIVLRLLVFVPGYFLLLISESVFLKLGTDPIIAQHAGVYCRYQFVPMICLIFFDAIRTLLLANGIFVPFLILQIALTLAHWILCAILTPIYLMDGVGWAMIISNIFSIVLLVGYVMWKKPCKESFFWPEPDSFKNLMPQFKQELPVGSTFYLEFLAFESTIAMGGQFPPLQLSVQVITLNFIGIMFTPILGLMMALISLMGNALGEKDHVKAGKIRKAGLVYAFFVLLLEIPVLYFFQNQIIGNYTKDPEVAASVKPILGIFMIFMIGDFFQVTNCSMLRAVGKEHLGFKIGVFAFYAIGLPIGYTLGVLLEWYSKGIWTGMTIGTLIGLSLSIRAWMEIDLAQQVIEIEERILRKKGLEAHLLGATEEQSIELKAY